MHFPQLWTGGGGYYIYIWYMYSILKWMAGSGSGWLVVVVREMLGGRIRDGNNDVTWRQRIAHRHGTTTTFLPPHLHPPTPTERGRRRGQRLNASRRIEAQNMSTTCAFDAQGCIFRIPWYASQSDTHDSMLISRGGGCWFMRDLCRHTKILLWACEITALGINRDKSWHACGTRGIFAI